MNEFAAPPFDGIWRSEDALAWLDARGGEVYRAVDGRRTVCFALEGKSYFAKTHRTPGCAEVLKNWASLRSPVWGAGAEVAAIGRLSEHGIGVPKVAAWGRRGRRSFLVTEDVGTQHTADEALREGLAPPQRRALFDGLARAVGAMHGAGVNHRDCYLVHVLVRHLDERRADLVLLDLHRAGLHPPGRVPRRWLAKDLGSLWFSAERAGAALSPRELRRFAARYAKSAGQRRAPRSLWPLVERRRARLVAEAARRGPRFGR